jgi:hypothetical protein
MKLIMSIPTFLTVLVVAIVIALPPPPIPVSAYSDSDESETNAEQRLQQKNVGSGESDNFNCDENLITSASDGVECIPSGPAPPPPPPPPETATLSVCKEVEFGTGEAVTFTVTGNGPEPDEFLVIDGNCVDVTIGPGEYTVTETDLSPFTSISGNCVQDPNNRLRATGEIQAGETQECIFTNTTD